MYDLLLLGSLVSGDKTGYKLQKIVGSALQPMRKVSSGVLYPSLQKLEEEQLISSLCSEDGRKTKLWHLTEKGHDRFMTLMKQPVTADAKRNDKIHFKLRSLDSVPLDVQQMILKEFQAFIEEDLAYYEKTQKQMAEKIKSQPEKAERFHVLVDSFELDITLAKTKLAWISRQLVKRTETE